VLPLHPGTRLRILAPAAAAGRACEIRGEAGFHVLEPLPADGSPLTVHAPPGPVTVTLRADAHGPALEQITDVGEGETAELRFEP
jgi:hypothetical protein